jgi:hypothetical protein
MSALESSRSDQRAGSPREDIRDATDAVERRLRIPGRHKDVHLLSDP